MIDYILAIALLLPALWYAAKGSSYLVDYAMLLFVFNREIRRVVDWWHGSFNAFSPISLTPLLLTLLLLGPLIARFGLLHSTPRRIFWCLFLAASYATFVGLARNGLAALYGAAEYFAPIGMMGFTATALVDDRTTDRWIRNTVWLAVAAALYGWYQYLTIPPWDAFWVQSVGFVGYLGGLAPTEMTVFSTFGERGPAALFFAYCAIPALLSRRWRLLFGWPEALLLISVILLTLVRAAVILVAFGVIVYPFVNRGKGSATVLLAAVIITLALTLGLNRLPGAEHINQRYATLAQLQQDGSTQGRLGIFSFGLQQVLTNPFGFGLGSTGLGGRVNSGSALGNRTVMSDNGYLEVLSALGLPGGFCFALAIFSLWQHCAACARFGLRDDFLGLTRTFLLVFLVGMFCVNIFAGFNVLWIVFGRSLSPVMLQKLEALFAEEEDGHLAPELYEH